ncbi:MAG: hypothetical protein JNK82_06725 [Myxococcaceae bacterium]|nr:hypothetical protein [Myxococcaceae bacterium]
MKTLLGVCVLAVGVVGCGELLPGPGGAGGGSGNGGGQWRQIELPLGQDRNNVLGVHCSSTDKCVIATESSGGDPGAVFVLTPTAVGEKLLDGKYKGEVQSKADMLGDLDFAGFDTDADGKLIARIDNSSVMTVATGDFTQKSSWAITNMGRSGGDTLPLNATSALQHDSANKWVFINRMGFVYQSNAAPGMTTEWTKVWSPTATPSIPADFAAQKVLEPTLCHSDVTAGGLPGASQPAYIAKDLSVIVTVAGGLNQHGNADPGVCISTDRGAHFFNVAFTDLTSPDVSSPGPIGVMCTDKDNCYAYNGLQFQTGTAYIYYSTNASAGKASTWAKATMPSSFATSDQITIQGIFFAPDKVHGWAVGNNAHKGMLLRTTDSGKTWADVSAPVLLAKDSDLYNGFALDKDNVWLVGRFGTVLVTNSAQQ